MNFLTLFESDPNSLSFFPSSGNTFDIMSPRAKLADGPSSSLGGTSSVKIYASKSIYRTTMYDYGKSQFFLGYVKLNETEKRKI